MHSYDRNHSQKIFTYLDEALKLKANYGDAKYFYGAECSANAFLAMQNYDADSLKYFYDLAFKKGAYPEWLIEFGKNILNNCDENTILFTAGNADFDVCSYLQIVDNYRKDITIIPIGNIDRPWYVLFLKTGLTPGIRNVNIHLSEKQIMDIHPFKWDTTDILINISPADIAQYKLPNDYKMKWNVAPDLTSNRLHSKIESEKPKPRTYLSPQKAILLQIVEDNFASRPIYFSNFASQSLYGGLETNFQNCGLISKLVPFQIKTDSLLVNKEKLENLLIPKNLCRYKTIKTMDIPRISGIVEWGYSDAFIRLANIYRNTAEKTKLTELIEISKNQFLIGYNMQNDQEVLNELLK